MGVDSIGCDIGRMFTALFTTIAVLVMALACVVMGQCTGPRIGSVRMYDECVRACEPRGGVREWKFESAACVCNDWSAWYIKPTARRVGR